MNKARLEGLSDAAFAIIFTLLVIEIRVPEELHHRTATDLMHALSDLTPLFVGYAISFAVLAMFWISHNALYGMFVKNINRALVGINMLFLAFAALLPFSAHLLGRYNDLPLAVQIYGLNVLAIGLVSILALMYALKSKEIDTDHVTARMLAQARIRTILTPLFTIVGILVVPFSIPLALILYMFPIVFNVIPGLLDRGERMLGINLG